MGLVLGLAAVGAGTHLLGIYSSDSEVLKYGMLRLEIICGTYFICGLMDCMVGSLRGLGYSVIPMIVSLTGACGFRILWILQYLPFTVHWQFFICHIRYLGSLRQRLTWLPLN